MSRCSRVEPRGPTERLHKHVTGQVGMSACILLSDSQRTFLSSYIQGDSGVKVNVFGCDSINHCEGKIVSMSLCLSLNGCRDRAV